MATRIHHRMTNNKLLLKINMLLHIYIAVCVHEEKVIEYTVCTV